MLFSEVSTNAELEPLVILVTTQLLQSVVSVDTLGSTLNWPILVSVSAPSLQPAVVGSLKSYVLVPPSDHTAVGPAVAAIVKVQPLFAPLGLMTYMRCVLEPNVPVDALAPDPQENKNDFVVIATDGLTTGTREASRISVLRTPGFMVWLNVGVLAALAVPVLPKPRANTNKHKVSVAHSQVLPGALPCFASLIFVSSPALT